MRDYGYAGYRGMGITSKVIPGMLKHTGTEPDLIEGLRMTLISIIINRKKH
jgi:hypothetical protein